MSYHFTRPTEIWLGSDYLTSDTLLNSTYPDLLKSVNGDPLEGADFFSAQSVTDAYYFYENWGDLPNDAYSVEVLFIIQGDANIGLCGAAIYNGTTLVDNQTGLYTDFDQSRNILSSTDWGGSGFPDLGNLRVRLKYHKGASNLGHVTVFDVILRFETSQGYSESSYADTYTDLDVDWINPANMVDGSLTTSAYIDNANDDPIVNIGGYQYNWDATQFSLTYSNATGTPRGFLEFLTFYDQIGDDWVEHTVMQGTGTPVAVRTPSPTVGVNGQLWLIFEFTETELGSDFNRFNELSIYIQGSGRRDDSRFYVYGAIFHATKLNVVTGDTIILDVASIAAAAQALTVIDSKLISLDTLSLAITAQQASVWVAAPQINVGLDAGTLTVSIENVTIDTGPVTVSIDSATADLTAEIASVLPGGISVNASSSEVSVSIGDLSLVTGEVAIEPQPLFSETFAGKITVTPIGVAIVPLQPAVVFATTGHLSIATGAISVMVSDVSISMDAIDAASVAGVATIELSIISAATQDEPLRIGIGVPIRSAITDTAAPSLIPIPGPVVQEIKSAFAGPVIATETENTTNLIINYLSPLNMQTVPYMDSAMAQDRITSYRYTKVENKTTFEQRRKILNIVRDPIGEFARDCAILKFKHKKDLSDE